MNFEFDHQKSCLNKEKHGIDFPEAQYLWLDPARVIIPARTLNEPRYLLIARFHGTLWSAVFTLRGDVLRIISVRNTRQNEKEIYQRRGI
ncbi:MAG: BrnT family toxin [Bacteroidota bacterium]